MEVWVTGATGFIGSALVDRLLARGDGVTALVRPGSLGRVPARAKGLRIVAGELPLETDPFADAPAPAVVFHCAAELFRTPAPRGEAVNVEGTAQIANLARVRGARLVFLSTVSVFGYRHRDAVVDESTACEPEGRYAKTKHAAEREILARGERGLDFAILRPPIVYGPGSSRDLVQTVARAIERRRFAQIGDGAGRMSLCWVGHCVDALLLLADAKLTDDRTFVVDDGAAVTHREISQTIARALGMPARFPSVPRAVALGASQVLSSAMGALGRRSPLTPWDVSLLTMSFALDIARIRRLGYAPAVPFDVAIARTVEGLREEGKL